MGYYARYVIETAPNDELLTTQVFCNCGHGSFARMVKRMKLQHGGQNDYPTTQGAARSY